MASSLSIICAAFIAVCCQQAVSGSLISPVNSRQGYGGFQPTSATTANQGGYTMPPVSTNPPVQNPSFITSANGLTCSTATGPQCTTVSAPPNQMSYVCPTGQRLANGQQLYYVQTLTPTYSKQCVAV